MYVCGNMRLKIDAVECTKAQRIFGLPESIWLPRMAFYNDNICIRRFQLWNQNRSVLEYRQVLAHSLCPVIYGELPPGAHDTPTISVVNHHILHPPQDALTIRWTTMWCTNHTMHLSYDEPTYAAPTTGCAYHTMNHHVAHPPHDAPIIWWTNICSTHHTTHLPYQRWTTLRSTHHRMHQPLVHDKPSDRPPYLYSLIACCFISWINTLQGLVNSGVKTRLYSDQF